MDINLINGLLEKYWNAETTVQEEAQLRSYFNGAHVDESVNEFTPLFKWQTTMAANASNEISLTKTAMISSLLDKYWEAETSLEEENLLKEYFASNHVDASFVAFKPLFQTYASIASVTSTQTSRVTEIKTVHKNIFSLKQIMAVAAIFTMVLASVFVMKQMAPDKKQNVASNYREIEDPQEAYEVTMAALAKVSRKYKKGQAQLSHGMTSMNEASIFKY